jgi:hypothetical protein
MTDPASERNVEPKHSDIVGELWEGKEMLQWSCVVNLRTMYATLLVMLD